MSLGIYVQVPFCQSKCTYCNFHTGVFAAALRAPYVDAVCREIGESGKLGRAAGEVVDTIYVGGGTPSLLEVEGLARMLNAIRRAYSCAGGEVTLEADPETVTPQKAQGWREAGFNRVSLGAQSFDDTELKATGRMHRSADIFDAERALRAAGFDNLSFDLIAGLPKQTGASWEKSLGELARLEPEHVSIYLMEIDEGSRLGREALGGGARYSAKEMPSEDAMADFYERACEHLAAAGYEHYEISNWARPGRRSRHNLKYWQREPYVGFGAGAHSFFGRERWANGHDPAWYVAAIQAGRSPVDSREQLTPQQELDEELFLGLRLLEGIELEKLESKYGVSLAERVAPLLAAELVEKKDGRIRIAPGCVTVSNEIFVSLMSEPAGDNAT